MQPGLASAGPDDSPVEGTADPGSPGASGTLESAAAPLSADQAWRVVAAIWTLYLVVVLLEVDHPARIALKALLMPSLALWVVVALGSDAPHLLTGGLLLSALGDLGVSFEPPGFQLGMLAFLGTHVAYQAGFLRMGALSAVRTNLPLPVAYVAFWGAANLVLGPRLGELRVPVLIYSLALCTTAALASGVDRRTATGGFLFLVSDLLIGLRRAKVELPGDRALVISTYLAAQGLIATSWVRRLRPETPIPSTM